MMKWTKTPYGLQADAGGFSIHKAQNFFRKYYDYTLKKGGGFVGVFPTENGCKMVANCIARELSKKPTEVVK